VNSNPAYGTICKHKRKFNLATVVPKIIIITACGEQYINGSPDLKNL
jgi:hypothetical protein